MSQIALMAGPVARLALKLDRLTPLVGLAGLAACVAAFAIPQDERGLVALGLGAALIWIAAILRGLALWHARARRRHLRLISELVSHDAAPAFTTDRAGVIGYQNAAAIRRFGGRGGATLVGSLADMFAAPSLTLQRLQDRALARGAAHEDVLLRNGHLRLSVHQVGEDGFLWRLEEIADRVPEGSHAKVSLPMLVLGQDDRVRFANDALRDLTGLGEVTLDRLINDLPLRPGGVHGIATRSGRARARAVVIEAGDDRRELYLVPEGPPRAGDWEALDTLPVALIKVSAEGEIMSANCPARALLAAEMLQGQPLGRFVEGLGRSVTDWVQEVMAGRGSAKPEFVRASQAKRETFLQMTPSRVEGPRGPEMIAVLSDATELKSLEAQFVQSQKMQAIGQLAGGVAHDFNNLLTAISGHCDLLLLRHDKLDPDYADLVQIHQNANRAASLVGQLLAFSRKQTLKPETIDLRDTLSDLTHLLNRLVGEKVRLTLDHDAGLLPVRADKRQLEQVIMNLVVNARDAMPTGGEIRVETRNVALREPLLRDRATMGAGDYVMVRVSDQGIGIPADKLQKVFEPFYTTKRTGEGTGLGLSTAYGIIKQTGGFIFVDSVPGAGTAFTIYLPSFAPPKDQAAPEPAEKPAGAARRGSGVVLLVEDEAPVRAFASRALRLRGYTVLEAENAEEALEMLADPDLSVDLFVSDVIMPGMDGPSWVQKALEARPETKVVFVSGYAEDSFSEQQARIPNSVFLPKPFSLGELTDTVHSQLG